jgi:hypothetical protein
MKNVQIVAKQSSLSYLFDCHMMCAKAVVTRWLNLVVLSVPS